VTRDQRLGILFMFGSVLGYSFFAVFVKLLLAEGMTPIDIGVMRFSMAVMVFWAVRIGIGVSQRRFDLPRLSPIAIGAMGLMMALAALTGFFGLQRLPAATYLVLFYSYPMMAALIEMALGRRLPATGWIALLLTLAGVAIAAPDFSAGLTGDNAIGVMIAFVNGLVVAIYYIVGSRVLKGVRDSLGATAIIASGALTVMLIAGLLLGFNAPPTPTAWLLIIGMAVVSTVVPVFLLNQAIPRLGSAQSGIIASIEPIIVSVQAMLLLGEAMSAEQWIGALVIVGGIVVLQAPSLLASRAIAKAAAETL
jgi:drug/metabolite transporter (DMT)-like permease